MERRILRMEHRAAWLGVLVPGHMRPESAAQLDMAMDRVGIALPP